MRKHHRLPTVDPSPRRLTPQNFEIRGFARGRLPWPWPWLSRPQGRPPWPSRGSNLPRFFKMPLPFSFWNRDRCLYIPVPGTRADVPNNTKEDKERQGTRYPYGAKPSCRKKPFLSRRRQQVRCRRSRVMKVLTMLVMIATSFTERGLGEVDPWLGDQRPRLDLQRKPRTT